MGSLVGIDVSDTFTELAFAADGEHITSILKVPTTPTTHRCTVCADHDHRNALGRVKRDYGVVVATETKIAARARYTLDTEASDLERKRRRSAASQIHDGGNHA